MTTRKENSLIDHICSNISNKLAHTNVILTDEISDHDTSYVIVNIKKERYEPRYKYIRNERKTGTEDYIQDFSKLPLSIVFGFDDPDNQTLTLNMLITDSIDENVPTHRVKLTRPIAAWMKDPFIVQAQRIGTISHKNSSHQQH